MVVLAVDVAVVVIDNVVVFLVVVVLVSVRGVVINVETVSLKVGVSIVASFVGSVSVEVGDAGDVEDANNSVAAYSSSHFCNSCLYFFFWFS